MRSLMLVWLLWATPALSLHIGAGVSSATSGRLIPAINAGVGFGNYLVSGMAAGAATKAYYTSSYTLNVMRYSRWGRFVIGELLVGYGLGGYYNEKGIVTRFESEAEEEVIERDTDSMIGPAFRVSLHPISGLFIALEFTMGLGWGAPFGGWGDEGIFAIGGEW